MEVQDPVDLCKQLSQEQDPDKIRDLSSQLRTSLREHALKTEGMAMFHFRNQRKYARKALRSKK